jgi:hypothetical protein
LYEESEQYYWANTVYPVVLYVLHSTELHVMYL